MASESAIRMARQHSLGDLPRRTAERTPDKLALVDGEMHLTFRDFDDAINRVSNALTERGLSHGDRCAVLARNCWEFAVLSFATARLGMVLVPINFMLNAEEIAFILAHSEAVAFVVQDDLTVIAASALEHCSEPALVRATFGGNAVEGWEPFAAWTSHGDATPVLVDVADDDPVRLMYTSGTESRPKGVLVTSRSLLWQYATCVIEGEMVSEDIDLHSLPMYHCAQMDCFLGPDIYVGSTSVITQGPEPSTLLRLIEQHRVTKFFAPPTVWIALLRSPHFDSADLSSLRKGYYGASAMPVEILREIAIRLPNVRLWNFYGQTEMSPLATILKPEEQMEFAGAAGRPSINVETKVVDDGDRPVRPGEIGEIVHRSPHAMLGYYKDHGKTDDAFRNGWFHTGDLGVFDKHGILRVVDRKKDMIKTGGENVSSREVEEAIYLLDSVAEVAVFGVAHPRWIEAVTAVVVARPGVGLTAAAVIEHARRHLAGYKTPKQVFIADVLPKNPSGKILKRELRETFSANAIQP
ncbi:fatty acyl-CoA synthetase [Arthrobacter sp. B2a2-09]|uniref:fatty acyl-CoA synthetase n=1 Tax=Arthrobacter sp. B2a2-09 TaxID=2952822 RepID=UPI0022CD8E7C|nr:fatty acyl-CoA synthetase [Arthrobacter sp. B2a2-09]MCZ9880627.1 fatty acyl-CoA synthetase [Arthrobacter sp. B2a2-09]